MKLHSLKIFSTFTISRHHISICLHCLSPWFGGFQKASFVDESPKESTISEEAALCTLFIVLYPHPFYVVAIVGNILLNHTACNINFCCCDILILSGRLKGLRLVHFSNACNGDFCFKMIKTFRYSGLEYKIIWQCICRVKLISIYIQHPGIGLSVCLLVRHTFQKLKPKGPQTSILDS